MPDRIHINAQDNILEIQSYGTVTSDDIASSIVKIREIHRGTGFFKVLVDTREQVQMPSTFAIYKLFSHFPTQFRVALLMSKDQVTATDIRFVETIAGNRGFRIRAFEDERHARRWLNAIWVKQIGV